MSLNCDHAKILIELIHEGNYTLGDLTALLRGVTAMIAESESAAHKQAMHKSLLRAAAELGKLRGGCFPWASNEGDLGAGARLGLDHDGTKERKSAAKAEGQDAALRERTQVSEEGGSTGGRIQNTVIAVLVRKSVPISLRKKR